MTLSLTTILTWLLCVPPTWPPFEEPVVITRGMSKTELSRAFVLTDLGAWVIRSSQMTPCYGLTLPSGMEVKLDFDDDDKINHIVVEDPRYRIQGIGVGSTLAEVQARFPQANTWEYPYFGYMVTLPDSTHFAFFVGKKGKTLADGTVIPLPACPVMRLELPSVIDIPTYLPLPQYQHPRTEEMPLLNPPTDLEKNHGKVILEMKNEDGSVEIESMWALAVENGQMIVKKLPE